MKAFKLLMFLIIGFGTNSLNGQTKYYLGYDANCMDRYEYHYTSNPTGNAHVAYHIIVNDREKIVLEVGIESRINQARPNNVKSCADFSINERMVRKINNGEVQLFIVKKSGSGYNVSEVGLSAYSQISPASISFSAMDGRYSYNYSQPANGTNLATASSNSSVYFEGLVSHDCPKRYQFNKKLKGGGENFVASTLIPEIGVLEEKRGFNATDAENKVLKLTSINGMPIESYLSTFCRNVDLDFYSGKFYHLNKADFTTTSDNDFVENNTVVTTTPSAGSFSTPNTETYTTNQPTYTSSDCQVYKDVDRGLYLMFGSGAVANLTCGGNTYRNGQLIGGPVSSSVTSRPTYQPPSTIVTTTPPQSTIVTTTPSRPSAPAFTPPTAEPVRRNSEVCNETSTYGFHVVQRHETLYRISKQYGITVNQLRLWNGLSSNRIYPCSKLRTINPQAAPNNSVVLTERAATVPNYNYNSATGIHTVSKNETLYGIATRYGYTVDRLRSLNGLGDGDRIYIGQQLRIMACDCPAPGDAAAAAPASEPIAAYVPAGDDRVVAYDNVPREYSTITQDRLVAKGNEENVAYTNGAKRRFHVVKEDDTIFYISKKYGITVEQLRKLNDLEKEEVIVPFQRIYLD